MDKPVVFAGDLIEGVAIDFLEQAALILDDPKRRSSRVTMLTALRFTSLHGCFRANVHRWCTAVVLGDRPAT